jgi:hypothetical protein
MKSKIRSNKNERAVGEKIHEIESVLLSLVHERDHLLGSRVNPETYYDRDGQAPTRFLELGRGRPASLRLAVEKSDGQWGYAWNIFATGRSVEEGDFQTSTARLPRMMLVQIMERYFHVLTHLQD